MNKEEIIRRSKEIHGDKYIYDLVEYKNNRSKIKIICPKHGVFEQSPANHIYLKQNCPSCSNKLRLNTDSFINKAKEIHGNKYDYSLVNYKNNFTKVKIICPIHDMFEQKPFHHIIQKSGCLKCSGKNQRTTEEFIYLADKIHDGLYDYSLVDYEHVHGKVKIICKKHGIFEQTRNEHINRRQGCPKCKKSKGENIIIKTLKDNNFNFFTQMEFDSCKDKRKLPFDFYLPEHNLCIEYDGIQHSESIDYWGGLDKFNYIKSHDKIKEDYCKDNNIRLIRIKYDRKLKSDDILEKIYNET